MPENANSKSSYERAYDVCLRGGKNPCSWPSSSVGMAKLLLSLYNGSNAFSYRECTNSFDSFNYSLALEVIQHFHEVGEDHELRGIAEGLNKIVPELFEEGRKRYYRVPREKE